MGWLVLCCLTWDAILINGMGGVGEKNGFNVTTFLCARQFMLIDCGLGKNNFPS